MVKMSLALGWLALAGVLSSAPSMGGELVVIASNAASMRVGALIGGDDPVRLDAGEAVTLVDGAGRVVKLEHPQYSAT